MAPTLSGSVMPSSPPAPLKQPDFLQRLALEANSDDDLSETLDELVSEFRTDDVDGPTDFTANLSYWMRHAQSRDPAQPAEIEEDESEDEGHEEIRKDAIANEETAHSQVSLKSQAEDRLREADLESEEELSSLLKELEELDREEDQAKQPNLHGTPLQEHSAGDLGLQRDVKEVQQPLFQAFVEDGSEMPSMFIPPIAKAVQPLEANSDTTTSRRQSAASSTPTNADRSSITTVSRPQSAEQFSTAPEPAVIPETLIVSVKESTPPIDTAVVENQMQDLMRSVEQLKTQLEQSMQAFQEHLVRDRSAHQYAQNEVRSKLDSMQSQSAQQQAPILDAVVSSQKHAIAASDKVSLALAKHWQQLSALEAAQTKSLRQQQEYMQRQQQQDDLSHELREAQQEAQELRDRNALLEKEMNVLQKRNEVLESDRKLMSRVLLQEWGQKDYGESEPQLYRYRYAKDRKRTSND